MKSIARIRDVITTGYLPSHDRFWSLSDSDYATVVTAPSRPAIAEAVAGFDPREAWPDTVPHRVDLYFCHLRVSPNILVGRLRK